MDRKGIVRIIESTFAVVVILGVLVLVSSRQVQPEQRDLSVIVPSVLEEVAHNFTLRGSVITKGGDVASTEIEGFLVGRLRGLGLNYSVEVCELDEVCFVDPYPASDPQDIFAGDRVISSSLDEINFKPKKVKLFLWRD